MNKDNKMIPIVKKLFKLHLSNDIKLIDVSIDKKNCIVIVYRNVKSLGIFGSLTLDGKIRKILESVLNLKSWQFNLIKKYDDGPEF